MYFCLNCVTGYENKVQQLVCRFLINNSSKENKVWFPMKENTERHNGRSVKVSRPMFPGYLFIYWSGDDEKDFPFEDIQRIKGVSKFLRYDDKSACLKGKDNLFAIWLHNNNGLIAQSKVLLQPGQKLCIVQGPLTGFDGQVVKVDKHHRNVTVRFDVAGIINDVIFSVEFIEKNITVEKLLRTV